MVDINTKHEQCLERHRLQMLDHEALITKISGEALEAAEKYQRENKDLHFKLETVEEKVQCLNEEIVFKENEIIEMGEKIQDALNENGKLEKENLTLEARQKELEEKDEKLLVLHNDMKSLTNQLGVLEEQERNMEIKLEDVSQEKQELEKVKILTISLPFFNNISFSYLLLKK